MALEPLCCSHQPRPTGGDAAGVKRDIRVCTAARRLVRDIGGFGIESNGRTVPPCLDLGEAGIGGKRVSRLRPPSNVLRYLLLGGAGRNLGSGVRKPLLDRHGTITA